MEKDKMEYCVKCGKVVDKSTARFSVDGPSSGWGWECEKCRPLEICICELGDYDENDYVIVTEGHYNSAGGYCCPHYGNTCGEHPDYDVRIA